MGAGVGGGQEGLSSPRQREAAPPTPPAESAKERLWARKPVTGKRAPAMSRRCQTGGPLLAHSQPRQPVSRPIESAASSFPAPCVFQACLSFSCRVSSVAALCTSPPCWFPELGTCPRRQTQTGRGDSLCWGRAWRWGKPPRSFGFQLCGFLRSGCEGRTVAVSLGWTFPCHGGADVQTRLFCFKEKKNSRRERKQ